MHSIATYAPSIMSMNNGSRITEHRILIAWQQSLAWVGRTVIHAAATKDIKGRESLADVLKQCCIILQLAEDRHVLLDA